MISYGKQTIEQSDIDAVVSALQGGWLTQGPAVERFESDLSRYFGSDHACAVANGTAALHLTGKALGWGSGDIIITTPITFLATVNCIVYSHATPEFVDIDPSSYTIDPNQVEEKVKVHRSNGRSVKAVIGVDFAGHPCDWKALREIADKYDLQLVNDNCHAMGASYNGDRRYALNYADVLTQSYHPVKHITTGEGGAALTNDPEIDEKIRRLRIHGMTKDVGQLKTNDGPWYYEMQEMGYNYRLSDFQCALGSSQLKRLDQFIEKRREIARVYDRTFSSYDFLKVPTAAGDVGHAYHLYALWIDFRKLSLNKIDFFERMKTAGISLQVHYIPVHLQPFYRRNYGFGDGDFDIAESFYAGVVSLPMYPSLSQEDVGLVGESLIGITNA